MLKVFYRMVFAVSLLVGTGYSVSAQVCIPYEDGNCCPYCCCGVHCSCSELSHSLLTADTLLSVRDEGGIISPEYCETTEKENLHHVFLKTNSLFLALLVPNLSVEMPLGRGWSLGFQYHHTWFKKASWNWIWKSYGLMTEARKYFPRSGCDDYTGHHIGVSGEVLTYNVNFGERGVLARRPNFIFSLDYGYSLKMNGWFRMDFTIGGGYSCGPYEEYKPIDNCYVWKRTMKRRYWGLTRAEISLVWCIEWKGGGR